MKIEHALIAVSRDMKLLHLIAYMDTPVYADYFAMIDEIANDPQFELTHLVVGRDYVVVPADEKIIDMVNQNMDERPEDFTVVEHGMRLS